MPTYVYRCEKHHELEISMTIAQMQAANVLQCPKCAKPMHRVPQAFSVNWGGLPPHLADSRPPVLKNFIDTAPERRAKYLDTERKKS